MPLILTAATTSIMTAVSKGQGAKLSRMAPLRNLNMRAGVQSTPVGSNQVSYKLAAKLQVVGNQAEPPCTPCAARKGPFVGCTRMDNFCGGVSAGWYYGGHPTRCSFWQGRRKLKANLQRRADELQQITRMRKRMMRSEERERG